MGQFVLLRKWLKARQFSHLSFLAGFSDLSAIKQED